MLYARLPGAPSGRMLSLTFRADGRCRDGRRHITPELEARLDAIARSMREFHYGRFELRFALDRCAQRGEEFLHRRDQRHRRRARARLESAIAAR